jgi:hypothetical protein
MWKKYNDLERGMTIFYENYTYDKGREAWVFDETYPYD